MHPSDEQRKETDRSTPPAAPESKPERTPGADDGAAKLTAEPLEERIAPMAGWTSNHNETLLEDR